MVGLGQRRFEYPRSGNGSEARYYDGSDQSAYAIQRWVNVSGGQASVTLASWIDPGYVSVRTSAGILRVEPGEWITRDSEGVFHL